MLHHLRGESRVGSAGAAASQRGIQGGVSRCSCISEGDPGWGQQVLHHLRGESRVGSAGAAASQRGIQGEISRCSSMSEGDPR